MRTPVDVVALRQLVQPASAHRSAGTVDTALPVDELLAPLLPWPGLRPGAVLSVERSIGATSLLLALIARASAAGSWTGVIGRPDLGIVAAHELGVEVARLVLVPDPGQEPLTVVDALASGMDIVIAAGLDRAPA
ncbi:MAG: hypothetical protein WCA46_17680, partial [Actinocatenispora sp.]